MLAREITPHQVLASAVRLKDQGCSDLGGRPSAWDASPNTATGDRISLRLGRPTHSGAGLALSARKTA